MSKQSKHQSENQWTSNETSSGFKPFGKGGMSIKLDATKSQSSYQQGQFMSPNESNMYSKQQNAAQLGASITTPRRLDILTNSNNVLRESSILFMQKLHFKPFLYGRCNEKLNLNLLDNTDIEVVEMNGDVGGSSKLLRNIAFTDFNVDLVEKMGYENFQKILRLWQLTINDFGQRQKEEQEKGEKLYTQYRQHLDVSQKIDAIKKTHTDKKAQLSEKLKQLQKQVNELKELSNKQGKYKCTYCEKTFESKEKVKQHISGSHQDMLKEIKQERQTIESFGNPIRTLTRREERQLEETNKILAEKVAKEVEEKMTEQLKKLLEKQEDLKKKRELEEMITIQVDDQSGGSDPAARNLHLANSIQKMNSVFGGFEDMFTQMQNKQQSLISEQAQQNQRLLEIERDQRRLEEEKEEQQREMQEQLRTIHQQQQLRIDLAQSQKDDDESMLEQTSKTQIIEDLQLQREPNFGNPFYGGSRKGEFNYGVDEDNKENTSSRQNKHPSRLPASTRNQLTSENLHFSQAYPVHYSGGGSGNNDMFQSKKSDLKKQFKEKYGSDDEKISEQKKKIKRLQHLGELESDYDSDLIQESEDEDNIDVLRPTNQNQLLRNAEIAFKEKLLTENELNDIQKNIHYRMAVLRKEAKYASNENDRRQKSNYYFETNSQLNMFTPIEQERRKNERLIQEVIQMNERRMNEGTEDDMIRSGGAAPAFIQQQQDINKMKKQFIQEHLNFQFKDGEEDITELDEQQFLKLKINYNSKFLEQPAPIIKK